MATSFLNARWFPSSVFGGSAVGAVATLGAVAAGAAIIEAALIPGLLIGGAAVLAPRLLSRDGLRDLRERLRRSAPSAGPMAAAPTAHAAEAPTSNEPAPFDTWRAVVKTLSYRAGVTTVDFGANYFVIGELATAAGLSGLSLVAGPIAYFAHEWVWHHYGPASAQHADPRAATVRVPPPGATGGAGDEPAGVEVSRAVAKTVTYEVVTAVSELGANFLFVRDLAAAAGLTTFSIVIAPVVYYVHEKAWDYYDAGKPSIPVAPFRKQLPAI